MNQILLRKSLPLNDPHSGFNGFCPGVTSYPKGYQVAPEYHPLEAGMIFERDVAVKLRDGITIYVDIFRPDTQTPVPAILCSSIFGKNGAYANYEFVSRMRAAMTAPRSPSPLPPALTSGRSRTPATGPPTVTR